VNPLRGGNKSLSFMTAFAEIRRTAKGKGNPNRGRLIFIAQDKNRVTKIAHSLQVVNQ